MADAKLLKILKLDKDKLDQYKAHFARYNGRLEPDRPEEPLDAFVRSKKRWDGWNKYKVKKRNDFNRKYIFSLMKFYPEDSIWLFGGIYEVLSIKRGEYVIKSVDNGKKFIGRLKLRHSYKSRAARVKLENYFDDFVISEILKEQYSG